MHELATVVGVAGEVVHQRDRVGHAVMVAADPHITRRSGPGRSAQPASGAEAGEQRWAPGWRWTTEAPPALPGTGDRDVPDAAGRDLGGEQGQAQELGERQVGPDLVAHDAEPGHDLGRVLGDLALEVPRPPRRTWLVAGRSKSPPGRVLRARA